jgi:hypothetical protein
MLTACGDGTPAARAITQTAVPTLPTFEDRLTPQQKAACVEFGKLAGQMAARRNEGATLSQELVAIRRLPSQDVIDELTNVAKLVYQNPAFDRQNPESEAMSFGMDCEMRIGKTQAGAKSSIPPRRLPLDFQNSKPSMGFRWSSFWENTASE